MNILLIKFSCFLKEVVVYTNLIIFLTRQDYELALNRLHLHVNYAGFYQYREGAIKSRPGAISHDIDIDQRESCASLYKRIIEVRLPLKNCSREK